jgi:uncharacterized membrane protein (UPF0127 family)
MSDTVTVVRDGGTVVCDRCVVADRMWPRMKGLLGHTSLPGGEGILLSPASSVHTLFMRFAIDVVFLDRDLRVLAVREAVRPWRAAAKRGARSTLELPAGEARLRGLAVGDRLSLAAPPG